MGGRIVGAGVAVGCADGCAGAGDRRCRSALLGAFGEVGGDRFGRCRHDLVAVVERPACPR